MIEVKKRKPPKRPYITRIDGKRSHCWIVRFGMNAKRDMPRIVKSFADGVYGGKRKALQAAVAFRDQTIAKLRKQGVVLGSARNKPWGRGWHYSEYIDHQGYQRAIIIATYWDNHKKSKSANILAL